MCTWYEQIHNTKFSAALAHFVDKNGEVPSEIWLQHAASIKEALAAPTMSKALAAASIARASSALEQGVRMEPTKSKLAYNKKMLMEQEKTYEKKLQRAAASLAKVDIHAPCGFCLDSFTPPMHNQHTFQVRFDVACKVGHRLVQDVSRCAWWWCSLSHITPKAKHMHHGNANGHKN